MAGTAPAAQKALASLRRLALPGTQVRGREGDQTQAAPGCPPPPCQNLATVNDAGYWRGKAAQPAGLRAHLVRRPTRFSPADSFLPGAQPGCRLPAWAGPGGLTQLEGGWGAGLLAGAGCPTQVKPPPPPALPWTMARVASLPAQAACAPLQCSPRTGPPPACLPRTPCHRPSPDSSLDTRCLLGPSPLPVRTLVYPPAASARRPWEVSAGWRAGREQREPARGAGLWVGAAVTQLGASVRGLPTPRLWTGICSEGSAWPPSR